MESQAIRTRQAVREAFLRKGMTIAGWARENGFDVATVNQVLSGHNKATRGVGHRIAVILRIKAGTIDGADGSGKDGEMPELSRNSRRNLSDDNNAA